MKKIYLVAALSLCLLLGACRAENPENLFESREGTDGTAPQEQKGQGILTAETGYQYGNMQKNLPPGNYMRYGEDIVFTELHNNQRLLYTYDMETGEISTFSKDATGVGSIITFGNLEVYNGELYMQSAAMNVMKLVDGQAERIVDGKVNGFWHANGNLYVRTKDSSLLVFEGGSKEARLLIDEYTSYWNVVFGQYLYGQGSALTRVDLLAEEPREEILLENASGMIDGEYIYYVDETNYFLYRCDIDGSNPVLLLNQPVLRASMNFDDTYFYYRLDTNIQLDEGEDCYDIYRFPKENPAQIEKIATLPVPAFTIYTVPGYDKIFVTTLGPRNENSRDESPTYVMGLDGSNPTPLELPDF